jgi:hypothetical protein
MPMFLGTLSSKSNRHVFEGFINRINKCLQGVLDTVAGTVQHDARSIPAQAYDLGLVQGKGCFCDVKFRFGVAFVYQGI